MTPVSRENRADSKANVMKHKRRTVMRMPTMANGPPFREQLYQNEH